MTKMDPLGASASIVALIGVSAKVLSYLNDVKDSSKQRVECVKELASLIGLLIELKHWLDVPHPDKVRYQAICTISVKDGPFEQFLTLVEEFHSKITRRDGLSAAIRWSFTKKDIDTLRTRIEAVKSTISMSIQFDHFRLSQSVKEDTRKIYAATESLETHTTAMYSSIQEHHEDQILRTALEWISPTSYPRKQADLITRRQAQTGNWFINSPEYRRWRKDTGSQLLCTGMPGAGKTIMAATVIEDLGKTLDLEKDGVAYVFCDYKEQLATADQSPFAAFLKQLVQNKPTAAEPLLDLYRRHDTHRTYPTLEELISALQKVIQFYESVYLIMDAVDEFFDQTPAQTTLLKEMYALQEHGDVRLLFTSRHIPRIVKQIPNARIIEIHADDNDIRAFALGKTWILPECVRENPGLMSSVLDSIVKAAGGMFLLAQLYIDRLACTHNVRGVRSVLADLPECNKTEVELSQAYFHIYDATMIRIKCGPFARLAQKTLSWISLAKRPLRTEELRYALAVEATDNDLDVDGLTSLEYIVSSCAGLITVDHHTDIVRFIHYTVQEYFNRALVDHFPDAPFYAATTCLTFLRFVKARRFTLPLVSWKSPYPFLDYSLRYWPDHARICEAKMLDKFISDETIRSEIIVGPWGFVLGSSLHRDPPLFIAIRLGFIHFFDARLKDIPANSSLMTNEQCAMGCTPLIVAAESGQIEMIRMLLARNDVEVNMRRKGKTALLVAAETGDLQVFSALRAHQGVDADAEDDQGNHCVHLAARAGHLPIIQLCIAKGTDADKVNPSSGETPLFGAILCQHAEVVRYLLEREDVQLDRRTQRGWTVIHYAALGRDLTIWKMVLKALNQRGIQVDVNTKAISSLRGSTALHFAIKNQSRHRNASLTIVKELIDMGVDVNAKDAFGHTAVHYAVEQVNEEAMRIFARTPDVDLEARSNRGQTPLAKAVSIRNLNSEHQFVDFLVDELHLDVHTRDNTGRPLLMLIDLPKNLTYEKIAVPLLRNGLSINCEDANGKTILVHQIEARSDDLIEWLAAWHSLDWDIRDKITGRENDDASKQQAEKFFEKMRNTYEGSIKCLGRPFCRRCTRNLRNCEKMKSDLKEYVGGPRTIDLAQDILIAHGFASGVALELAATFRQWNSARRIIAKDHDKCGLKTGALGAHRSRPMLPLGWHSQGLDLDKDHITSQQVDRPELPKAEGHSHARRHQGVFHTFCHCGALRIGPARRRR